MLKLERKLVFFTLFSLGLHRIYCLVYCIPGRAGYRISHNMNKINSIFQFSYIKWERNFITKRWIWYLVHIFWKWKNNRYPVNSLSGATLIFSKLGSSLLKIHVSVRIYIQNTDRDTFFLRDLSGSI